LFTIQMSGSSALSSQSLQCWCFILFSVEVVVREVT
jgi:hypothetical protein